MNYNFAENSVLPNTRTRFECGHNWQTTAKIGEVTPIYVKEVLPGDIIELPTRYLIRMTTPIYQTMDVLYCDFHFYYVPFRMVWKHFKNFQGERNVGPHETQPEYTIPYTTAPTESYEKYPVNSSTTGTFYVKNNDGTYTEKTLPTDYVEGTIYYRKYEGWREGSLADKFGIPTRKAGIPGMNSLYLRAYALICNEWYRDQNRQDLVDWDDGDSNETGSNGDNYVTDIIKGGRPFKACKIHDYFTSTLLSPQGNAEPVLLPLGEIAPIKNSTEPTKTGFVQPTVYKFSDNTPATNVSLTTGASGTLLGQEGVTGDRIGVKLGLVADLSTATASTVNQLRRAFQLQKIFEANARSGTRYVEILRNRWNVVPDDLTIQRPEYLGGERIPLTINEVLQTSSTDNTSPLGQVGGYSKTIGESYFFNKGFKEHGMIIGVAVVRNKRKYQQGMHKMFTRRNLYDLYVVEFQNLGEVPVYNYEIFASGNSTKDNQAFGYQEYAAEYRYEIDRVCGDFRSNALHSLDYMHYADNYSDTPVNNDEWIVQDSQEVDRTITIDSEMQDPIQFDLYYDEIDTRSMPAHSIPGFIDHH